MSLVKNLLDWNERKLEEIDVINDKHPYLKAFGLGAIDGLVDGAVIAYIPLLIGCTYWRIKANKK